jgi:hypothetical protein
LTKKAPLNFSSAGLLHVLEYISIESMGETRKKLWNSF